MLSFIFANPGQHVEWLWYGDPESALRSQEMDMFCLGLRDAETGVGVTGFRIFLGADPHSR